MRRKAVIPKAASGLLRVSRLLAGMDLGDHRAEVIQSLLLEAGQIMEDSAPELALSLPANSEILPERVDRLARSAQTLSALAAAAQALLSQSQHIAY